MGLAFRLLDGASRLLNKLIMQPAICRSLAACGKGVSIGRRFEVAGLENITLGNNVYIGPGATVLSTRAKIDIGNYVMSGPNLTVITGDHRIDILDRPMMLLNDADKLPENDQDVIISDDVWIGSGVTILKGVKVSSHCVIASGAVVTRDVEPEYSIWGGVPARCIGSRIKD